MSVWLWLWTQRGCLFLLAHFCNSWIITLLFIYIFIGQWATPLNLLTIILCDHTVLSHIKGLAEILKPAYLLEDGTLFNLIADYRNHYRKVIQSIPLQSEIHLCHSLVCFFGLFFVLPGSSWQKLSHFSTVMLLGIFYGLYVFHYIKARQGRERERSCRIIFMMVELKYNLLGFIWWLLFIIKTPVFP